MKRRFFLQTFLGGSIAGTGIWLFSSKSVIAQKILEFIVRDGHSSVENARPIPQFVVENFSDSAVVRFFVIGDWGAGSKIQQDVAKQMAQKSNLEKTQFVISTGDNIYPNGVSSVDDKQWETKFRDIYKNLNLPWYSVLGNHDYRGDPDAQVAYSKQNSLWNMPARYFQYSKEVDAATSIDFFCLDTQAITENIDVEKQISWLKQALSGSKARWKFAVGHHPLRSYGHYGDNKKIVNLLKPLFDEFHLDCYFCGHDHDLQFIKSPQDSFHCVVSGAGGGSRNTAFGDNTIFAATNGGFVSAIVKNDKLHLQFINREGNIIFAQSILKS